MQWTLAHPIRASNGMERISEVLIANFSFQKSETKKNQLAISFEVSCVGPSRVSGQVWDGGLLSPRHPYDKKDIVPDSAHFEAGSE